MIKKFEQFVNEIYNRHNNNWSLVNESQESKSQSDAIKLLMDKKGWSKEKANKFVREDLRNDLPSLRDKQIGKFTLGVTRMYIDGELSDANLIGNLNITLKLLSAHINEYDRNLNGLSAIELISKFEKNRENNIKKEKQEIDRMKFDVSNYDIVKIDSYSDAKKYYEYTNPNSRWCLTYMENMYDNYTCNGINQIYFCLIKGFEEVEPIVGENAPLDDYGLSMLSIIVSEKGELAYCTCRWNHDNDGTDSIMDAVEISKVVNVNFYETFKPNTKWKDMVDNAKNKLANGESPNTIFDKIGDFKNGYALVLLNGKWNFINSNGDFISDNWFDHVEDFKDECAKIKLHGKWNFINTDGKILSNDWFNTVNYFKNGCCLVNLNGKFNYIKTDGSYLCDKWYDYMYPFVEGFAQVKLNGKWNFINTDGNIISDEWFSDVYDFENGLARVKSKRKCNHINTNGKTISDEWFDDCGFFDNYGYATVNLNDKWNFINTDGKLLSDEWFDEYCFFDNYGYAIVSLNGKWNFINTDGKLLSDEWFDDVFQFHGDYAKVELNDKHNYIDTDGKLLSDKWFDSSDDLKDYYNKVVKNKD